MSHRQRRLRNRTQVGTTWNRILKELKLDEVAMFEIVKRDKSGEVLQYIKIFWDGKIEGIGTAYEVMNRVPTLLEQLPGIFTDK